MGDHTDDQVATVGASRRRVLKQLGVGAGMAWAAPVVLSLPASAATGSAPPGSTCVQVASAGDYAGSSNGGPYKTVTVTFVYDGSGAVLLAGNCAGTASTIVDDEISISGPGGSFNHDYVVGACAFDGPLAPTDISSVLVPGSNSVSVTFINSLVCQGPHGVVTDIFLVQA